MRVEVAELLTALAHAEERLGRHPAAAGHRDEARQVLASCPDPGYVWADPRAEPDPPALTMDHALFGRCPARTRQPRVSQMTRVEISAVISALS